MDEEKKSTYISEVYWYDSPAQNTRTKQPFSLKILEDKPEYAPLPTVYNLGSSQATTLAATIGREKGDRRTPPLLRREPQSQYRDETPDVIPQERQTAEKGDDSGNLFNGRPGNFARHRLRKLRCSRSSLAPEKQLPQRSRDRASPTTHFLAVLAERQARKKAAENFKSQQSDATQASNLSSKTSASIPTTVEAKLEVAEPGEKRKKCAEMWETPTAKRLRTNLRSSLIIPSPSGDSDHKLSGTDKASTSAETFSPSLAINADESPSSCASDSSMGKFFSSLLNQPISYSPSDSEEQCKETISPVVNGSGSTSKIETMESPVATTIPSINTPRSGTDKRLNRSNSESDMFNDSLGDLLSQIPLHVAPNKENLVVSVKSVDPDMQSIECGSGDSSEHQTSESSKLGAQHRKTPKTPFKRYHTFSGAITSTPTTSKRDMGRKETDVPEILDSEAQKGDCDELIWNDSLESLLSDPVLLAQIDASVVAASQPIK